MIEVKGKYTNAYIMIDQVDENCMAQIIQMINHEAFTNPVRIMPDTHSGTGSVIGFTMPIGERLIANVIGVDISCGMLTFNLGKIEINHKELDDKIRENIPFGIHVRKIPMLNFTRDFKWNYADCKWSYEWFKDLCKRVEIDPFYVQQSVGTLGGGKVIASRP